MWLSEIIIYDYIPAAIHLVKTVKRNWKMIQYCSFHLHLFVYIAIFLKHIYTQIYSITYINISSFSPTYFASSAHLVGCGIFDQGAVYLFGQRSLTRVHWHERLFIVLISDPDCLRRPYLFTNAPVKNCRFSFSLH